MPVPLSPCKTPPAVVCSRAHPGDTFMYRDIYTAIRPHLDCSEEAAFITAEVLECYSLMTHADIDDAEPIEFDLALFSLLEEDTLPWDLAVACSLSVMHEAGIRDINPPEVDVTDRTLYLGSSEHFSAVDNVVPGQWAVLHTSKFTAMVCQSVAFDHEDGHYEMSEHDAGGCYGVFADPTAVGEAFTEYGPSVSPDGLTIRPTLRTFKAAAHRRVDGRCDAIFLSESNNV